jgi:hypothetical protein
VILAEIKLPPGVLLVVMQDGRVFEAKEEAEKKFSMIKLAPCGA